VIVIYIAIYLIVLLYLKKKSDLKSEHIFNIIYGLPSFVFLIISKEILSPMLITANTDKVLVAMFFVTSSLFSIFEISSSKKLSKLNILWPTILIICSFNSEYFKIMAILAMIYKQITFLDSNVKIKKNIIFYLVCVFVLANSDARVDHEAMFYGWSIITILFILFLNKKHDVYVYVVMYSLISKTQNVNLSLKILATATVYIFILMEFIDKEVRENLLIKLRSFKIFEQNFIKIRSANLKEVIFDKYEEPENKKIKSAVKKYINQNNRSIEQLKIFFLIISAFLMLVLK